MSQRRCRHTPEQIIRVLREVEKLLGRGDIAGSVQAPGGHRSSLVPVG
jgi:hypothetical protein